MADGLRLSSIRHHVIVPLGGVNVVYTTSEVYEISARKDSIGLVSSISQSSRFDISFIPPPLI